MKYQIEHKGAFTVIGFSTHILPNEGYQKCPEFWEKEYTQKYTRLWKTMEPITEEERAIVENKIGMLALCIEGQDGFSYMIAGVYQGGAVPEGMELYAFKESDWAVFTARGSLPKSLQDLNTEVWQSWYPNEGQAFLPNGTATVECYSYGDQRSENYEVGIWIPVVPK